jgi:hypothetical protein
MMRRTERGLLNMRSFLPAALAVALAACGSGPAGTQTITNVQQNSMPQGTIQGRITDAATGLAVPGATVTVYEKMPVIAMSDMSGRYSLGPLAAGSSYDVTIEAPGYVRRIESADLGGAAGNYPVGNAVTTLDVDMAKGDATLNGLVITSTTQPAVGAQVFADLRPLGFDVLLSAKADMSGKFTLNNVPGAASGLNITVNVAPYDANMDGMPDYSASSTSFRMYPGFTTTGTITLSSVGVTLVESNIAAGDLGPTDPITLTFASPIAANQSTFTLRSNVTGLNVGATEAWDPAGAQLTLTPAGTLVLGQSYTLSYTVHSTSGAQSSGSLSFTVRASASATPPGAVANLRITSPAMMKYDYNTFNVSLAWDPLMDAGGCRIYAKDTIQNPAYLALTTLNSATTTTASVNLSQYFGVSGAPLGFGNHVTIAVVALDKAGNEAPLTMASTVDVSDNVAPTVFANEVGSANNLGSPVSRMITYTLNFSEPMLQSVTPQLALNNASVTATFMWQTPNTGVFTLTVPPMTDGTGPTMVSGAKDTSGNAIMTLNGSLL